jgi:hypothetical protein
MDENNYSHTVNLDCVHECEWLLFCLVRTSNQKGKIYCCLKKLVLLYVTCYEYVVLNIIIALADEVCLS